MQVGREKRRKGAGMIRWKPGGGRVESHGKVLM